MPAKEPNVRDAKLIQYLNEAYGKERELETALQAHIAMTDRKPYKKRLQDHLKETKAQAKGLQRRIKQLGGKAEIAPMPGPDVAAEAAGQLASVAKKAVAAAQGPLHALRGTGNAERMLKNAKTEFSNEHEEIANYKAIESLATLVNDTETAKLAKQYLREEERMASYLERLIPQLTRAVAQEEIPAAERRANGRASSASRTRRAASSPRSSSSRSAPARSASARSGSGRSNGRTSKAAGTRATAGSRSRSASRPKATSGS